MVDLTPFGFTATESHVYASLLRLGPATGYEVGRHARVARANAYAALEGLVRRGAAVAVGDRPRRYRPVDPATLLATVAARQGEALDRLAAALSSTVVAPEPVTREMEGIRATANVIAQLVARAERQVTGVLSAALWPPTLPAWRLAATRGQVTVKAAGTVAGGAALLQGTVDPGVPTLLLIDESHVVTAEVSGDDARGVWSSHPAIAYLARRALEAMA
jgi:sugar-specific transcriptional regulator TrmB